MTEQQTASRYSEPSALFNESDDKNILPIMHDAPPWALYSQDVETLQVIIPLDSVDREQVIITFGPWAKMTAQLNTKHMQDEGILCEVLLLNWVQRQEAMHLASMVKSLRADFEDQLKDEGVDITNIGVITELGLALLDLNDSRHPPEEREDIHGYLHRAAVLKESDGSIDSQNQQPKRVWVKHPDSMVADDDDELDAKDASIDIENISAVQARVSELSSLHKTVVPDKYLTMMGDLNYPNDAEVLTAVGNLLDGLSKDSEKFAEHRENYMVAALTCITVNRLTFNTVVSELDETLYNGLELTGDDPVTSESVALWIHSYFTHQGVDTTHVEQTPLWRIAMGIFMRVLEDYPKPTDDVADCWVNGFVALTNNLAWFEKYGAESYYTEETPKEFGEEFYSALEAQVVECLSADNTPSFETCAVSALEELNGEHGTQSLESLPINYSILGMVVRNVAEALDTSGVGYRKALLSLVDFYLDGLVPRTECTILIAGDTTSWTPRVIDALRESTDDGDEKITEEVANKLCLLADENRHVTKRDWVHSFIHNKLRQHYNDWHPRASTHQLTIGFSNFLQHNEVLKGFCANYGLEELC